MNLLLLISGWFLWEKWKSKHLDFWVTTKEKLLSTHFKKIRIFHDQSTRVFKYIDTCRRKIVLSLTKLRDRIFAHGGHGDDIEMGRQPSILIHWKLSQITLLSEASAVLSRPKIISANERTARDRDILNTAAQLTIPHVEALSSDLADAHTENSRQSVRDVVYYTCNTWLTHLPFVYCPCLGFKLCTENWE